MKIDKIQDERILSEKNKIQSDCFKILIAILAASCLIQQFIFKAPFSEFAVEFFSLIICQLFITIRELSLGVYISPLKHKNVKNNLIYTFLSGITFILVFIFLTGESNKNILLLLFTCFITVNFLLRFFSEYFNNKKLKEIDAMNQDDVSE